MTIESRRKQLLADRRQWGDPVSYVPHTPGPDHSRENLPVSTPIVEPTKDGPLVRPPIPKRPISRPVNAAMISTKGWTLDSLINKSINFHHVRRISARSTSLSQNIHDYEESGVPLVIEDCHEHQNWSNAEFTLDSFASATPNEINVRNVHDWQDTTMSISRFITRSRSIASFAEEGERERFYGKDADCPKHWENWLQFAGVVPQLLLSGGPQDLFQYRPKSSPVETLMCYLGVGDTFTPCHKDLCASSGQNLMCHTENGGSSFWFMTESASALEVAKFFHSLGKELDHEDYVITVEELSNAPFKVYILEQKLGDLVLVPPRSAHQVVNFGGITVKTSWSRMTLKGLVEAYHHELPIYRRVCRPETYRVKSTIHYALLGLTWRLRSLLRHTNTRHSCDEDEESLVSNIKELLLVYGLILADELETHRDEMSRRQTANKANFIDDEHIICDFCGADIFQSFFECRECVETDSAEREYVVCPGCYAEGRSCKCEIMQRMQRRQFKSLLDTRAEAVQAVKESRLGRTFQPNNDFSDINNDNYPRTFRAASILLDIRKKMKNEKVCTRAKHANGSSHNVPFPWALTCKMCHHAKCFSHILSEHRTHSVEALLLHNSDGTHQKYHHNHTVGRKARLETSPADVISGRAVGHGYQQLAYYAINFLRYKPIKPQFMKLGWYDKTPHSFYISDDQESPRAEMESILAPDTTAPAPTETTVQPPTNSMSDVIVKGTRKRKAYVLVPSASYRTRLPDPASNSQPTSHTIALLSGLLLAPPRSWPGQGSPLLQENRTVPKALATLKPSTSTPSDLGRPIPTTVRKSGEVTINTEVAPPNRIIAEETLPIERQVKSAKSRTISKRSYVANPVTAQVITKGSLPKFNRLKSKPNASSSNDAKALVSTSVQEGGVKPSLLESQVSPPMASSETASVIPAELAASKFAEAVIQRVGYFLCQGASNPGQPMNSADTSSNSNGDPQTYSHSQYFSGQPQYYYTQAPQHNGPPPHYNGQPPHNGPPQPYNSQPPQYNGHPQRYTSQPPQYGGPSQHYGELPPHNDYSPHHYKPPQYSSPPHQYYGHPQQHNSPPQHHYNDHPHHYNDYIHQYSAHVQHSHTHPQHHLMPSNPMANQPQFHQDNRKPPYKQAASGKMRYMNHQPQDGYSAYHNGRNQTSVRIESAYKKRKQFAGSAQDAQSQTRFSSGRFSHGAQPPQGPRGYRKHKPARNYSTSERVKHHNEIERSTSRGHERSSWGTSKEGTPSTSFPGQSSHGHGDHHQHTETTVPSQFDCRSHGIESSTQRLMDNRDATMDVDSNHVTRFRTPLLPAADPTIPTTQTTQGDLAFDEGDAQYGERISMDVLPVPATEDEGNDQMWEDSYGIPDERAIKALAPESAPQSAPAARRSPDSTFHVDDDDCMADVTANPWASFR